MTNGTYALLERCRHSCMGAARARQEVCAAYGGREELARHLHDCAGERSERA